MNIIELLKDYYDREMNNVFCYSANWLMNCPKKGFEREFSEAQERAALIRAHLAELGAEV